jgi:toxin YoeB
MAKYQIVLSPQAVSDLKYWNKNKREVLTRFSRLLDAIAENPSHGIGKPKELHYDFQGLWSRRIDKDHRIIYEVKEMTIEVLSLRGHYGDK